MHRGFVLTAEDLGSTLGLGHFAACHSPSLSTCFLSYFQLSCQYSQKANTFFQKTTKKKKNRGLHITIVTINYC